MGKNGGIDKGLISKIYKQLTRLNIKNKNKNQCNQKMGGRSKEILFQRHTDGQKAYKRRSTSLIVREMQTKST